MEEEEKRKETCPLSTLTTSPFLHIISLFLNIGIYSISYPNLLKKLSTYSAFTSSPLLHFSIPPIWLHSLLMLIFMSLKPINSFSVLILLDLSATYNTTSKFFSEPSLALASVSVLLVIFLPHWPLLLSFFFDDLSNNCYLSGLGSPLFG